VGGCFIADGDVEGVTHPLPQVVLTGAHGYYYTTEQLIGSRNIGFDLPDVYP
jgi:hypothetical protein